MAGCRQASQATISIISVISEWYEYGDDDDVIAWGGGSKIRYKTCDYAPKSKVVAHDSLHKGAFWCGQMLKKVDYYATQHVLKNVKKRFFNVFSQEARKSYTHILIFMMS